MSPHAISAPATSSRGLMDLVRFYRSHGLCVVPAIYGDKRPAIDWKPWQVRKPSDAEIQTWFGDGKAKNVALVCGQVSDNLVGLDCDKSEIYVELSGDGEIERKTPVIKTARGYDIILKTDKPVASQKWLPIGFEIHSEGTIIIAPPSKHPSGFIYHFVNPEIKEIMRIKTEDLKEVINGILQKYGIGNFDARFFPNELRKVDVRPYLGRHPPCIAKILKGVGEGNRHMAAMNLASYLLFTRDINPDVAYARLRAWNMRNRPPLPERDLVTQFRKVLQSGYRFGCRGLASFCNNCEWCPFKGKRDGLTYALMQAKSLEV